MFLSRADLIHLLQAEVDRIKALQRRLGISPAAAGEHDDYLGRNSGSILRNEADAELMRHQEFLSKLRKLLNE